MTGTSMSGQTGAETPIRRFSRGAVRQAEIRAVAEQLFLEQGYGATTMDEIAARAGASKATMYKQFGSKDALFAEIVRAGIPDLTGPSLLALSKEGSCATVLSAWTRALFAIITAPRAIALYKMIVAESPRSPELAGIFYEKCHGAVRAQLAVYIRGATAAGQMRCDDPEMAALLFVSLAFGQGFERALVGLPPETDIKRYISEAVTTFLARYGV